MVTEKSQYTYAIAIPVVPGRQDWYNVSMKIHELHYCATNTYLIEGSRGRLLFDTGWAGTFPAFCHAMGGIGIAVQNIDRILVSHYHPDHMGIAGEIADMGPVILVADVQKDYIHASDSVFAKDPKCTFHPIAGEQTRIFSIAESRSLLREIGLDGQILHTPGHSDDSISLLLDDGSLFVGDLNPLYELEMHRETTIGKSWDRLLDLDPVTVYYGHAKTADLRSGKPKPDRTGDIYQLTEKIMHLIDRGWDLARIRKKTGAEGDFIENVARMYLTHRGVGVQGILDRIEIKNR